MYMATFRIQKGGPGRRRTCHAQPPSRMTVNAIRAPNDDRRAQPDNRRQIAMPRGDRGPWRGPPKTLRGGQFRRALCELGRYQMMGFAPPASQCGHSLRRTPLNEFGRPAC